MTTTGTLLAAFVAYKVLGGGDKKSTSTENTTPTATQTNVDNTQRDVNTGIAIGKAAFDFVAELYNRKSGSTRLGG